MIIISLCEFYYGKKLCDMGYSILQSANQYNTDIRTYKLML